MKDICDREQKPRNESRRYWAVMTLYERFEHGVALILSAIIAVIIVAALWQLLMRTGTMLLAGVFDPLSHDTFKAVFGMIMTLLIAMEFKHSILKVIERKSHIVQAKTVLLIAQLALARKFIILDLASTEAAKLAALGVAMLVLGVVYWLLDQRDERRWLTRSGASREEGAD